MSGTSKYSRAMRGRVYALVISERARKYSQGVTAGFVAAEAGIAYETACAVLRELGESGSLVFSQEEEAATRSYFKPKKFWRPAPTEEEARHAP